jgi:hypothetical protein
MRDKKMREPDIFKPSLLKLSPLLIIMGGMSYFFLFTMDPKESMAEFCGLSMGLIFVYFILRFIIALPYTYVSLDDINLVFSYGRSKKHVVPWKLITKVDLEKRDYGGRIFIRHRNLWLPNIYIQYLTESPPQSGYSKSKVENSPYYKLSFEIQFYFKNMELLQKRIWKQYKKYDN